MNTADKAALPVSTRNFPSCYHASGQEGGWYELSERFRLFWRDRVMGMAAIPSRMLSARRIRILDRNGRGNKPHSEAVAGVMVPEAHVESENRSWARLSACLGCLARRADATMIIPFKEEQRSQTAQKTRNPVCSALTPEVRVIDGKTINSLRMLKTLTSGQLRFSGLTISAAQSTVLSR